MPGGQAAQAEAPAGTWAGREDVGKGDQALCACVAPSRRSLAPSERGESRRLGYCRRYRRPAATGRYRPCRHTCKALARTSHVWTRRDMREMTGSARRAFSRRASPSRAPTFPSPLGGGGSDLRSQMDSRGQRSGIAWPPTGRLIGEEGGGVVWRGGEGRLWSSGNEHTCEL